MSVTLVGLAMLAALTLAAVAVPAAARTGELQSVRAQATALATEVAALDAQIDAAVQRGTRAADSLAVVRAQIGGNKRLQKRALCSSPVRAAAGTAAAARARTASKAKPTSVTLTGGRLGWQRSSVPPP